MSNPVFTVIAPIFNELENLPLLYQRVSNAMEKTGESWELVLVDDGSKDATLGIAKSYEAPNVKVIATENRGASSARNLGFSVAQGEYIQWLDADDLLRK